MADKLPRLVGASFRYVQDADACSDHQLEQTLDVSLADGGAGAYFVLSTSRWAIDSIDDIAALLNRHAAKVLVDVDGEED